MQQALDAVEAELPTILQEAQTLHPDDAGQRKFHQLKRAVRLRDQVLGQLQRG